MENFEKDCIEGINGRPNYLRMNGEEMKQWVEAWCFLARLTFFLTEGSAYISCALQNNQAMGGGLVFPSWINFLSNEGIYIHFLCTEDFKLIVGSQWMNGRRILGLQLCLCGFEKFRGTSKTNLVWAKFPRLPLELWN